MNPWAGVLSAILLVQIAPAQQAPATVTTIDGAEYRAQVTVVDGRVRLQNAEQPEAPAELSVEEVAAIDQTASVRSRRPGTTHSVWLRSGGQLPAKQISGLPRGEDGPQLVSLELPFSMTPAQIPLRNLAAIRMLRKDAAAGATVDRDRPNPNPTLDYLYVMAEGRVRRFSVTVEGLEGTKLKFDMGGRKLDYELDGVVGIVFGRNTGVAPDEQPKPRATVTIATGAKVAGKLLALTDRAELRTDEGAQLVIPRDRIRRIDLASNKLLHLTELTAEVEQTPALDRVWPWLVNRAPGGPGIQLGGQEYVRGLVLIPRTRLTYDVGGDYDFLETVIGIEDRAGPQAHAIFRVIADGRAIYESEPFTRGMSPEVLRLPISGIEKVALEADFGKNFDLGDHCVFANPRVIQK